MEPFDAAKSDLPARRDAPRDVGHRASAATWPESRFGPPKAQGVAPAGQRCGPLVDSKSTRDPCLASRRDNPVKLIPYQRETI
jgi:hypothetical protein